MIVDRHESANLFALLPELRLEMEPELAELDGLLEDDEIFGRVKADLSRRYPNSATLGRPSTPVEVILRMLVVRRLYDFSYEQTEHFVSDSITLRQFCHLYLEPAPDDTTLIRWARSSEALDLYPSGSYHGCSRSFFLVLPTSGSEGTSWPQSWG